MAILVECICEAKYEVEESLAGGVVDCEKCKRELPVPDALWDKRYRETLAATQAKTEAERLDAYRAIGKLGTASAVPALSRGLYDASRAIVNRCMSELLAMDGAGREHLVNLVRQGALKVSRLVAMVREEKIYDAADILCDLIDAGKFTESEIAEMVPLLGEAQRQRCVATLNALRRAWPNLAVLVDNALARYPRGENEETRLPEAATRIDSGSLVQVREMAESRRTAKRSGCLGLLCALIVLPAAAGTAIWLLAG